ncbi:MAG: aconitase X catalytic domain-containing protein [Synergistes jonesii]|uniref:aconitase X catalytic domain-containing protein n=1 Tax=Synergistes jonesii TaxID=2754 RepID=UPI002A74BB77|nr:aconitase X catalytic domain-containing protein [Synergistes jonesii]MDY2985277.1 aconitase X catalytic domain-containing protein [Synergistes jonesii]
MFLTDEEKSILDGKRGAGYQKAMELIYALGLTFDAEKLIPIKRAHVALSGQEGDTYWCELLVNGGAVCAVPPTTNPYWDTAYLTKFFDVTREELELAERTGDAYRRIGAKLTYHCAPGLGTNVPFFGEHVAFSESSATPYVNGALGARSNRESSVSALAAAVIGKTPLYGYHLDECRRGDFLIDVDADMPDCYDWGILGHCVGKIAGPRNPVLRFKNTPRPRQEDFLYFGAEAATSGAVAMYHMVGVTPEAPTLEAAFGSRKIPSAECVITNKELKAEEDSLTPATGEINLVMLGCPHYTYTQLLEVERLFAGRRVNGGTAFWILAEAGAVELAERSHLRQRLELLGVRMVGDTCIDEPCWKSFEGRLGVTDSPKCAYYRERRGQPFAIRRLSVCVEAAVKGRLD